jgi:hypothetical protein
MSELDWTVLIGDIEHPLTDDERAEAIAAVLAGGQPSRSFCLMLAEMIRPNGKNSSRYCFKLCRKDRGRPKDAYWPVAFEMERLVDVEGLHVDEAVYRIQQKFGAKGNSKRKCEAALKAARKWTRLDKFFDEHVAKAG